MFECLEGPHKDSSGFACGWDSTQENNWKIIKIKIKIISGWGFEVSS